MLNTRATCSGLPPNVSATIYPGVHIFTRNLILQTATKTSMDTDIRSPNNSHPVRQIPPNIRVVPNYQVSSLIRFQIVTFRCNPNKIVIFANLKSRFSSWKARKIGLMAVVCIFADSLNTHSDTGCPRISNLFYIVSYYIK